MIDWAVAARGLAGQETSGDDCAVVAFDGGTLCAVADGLGHGPEAAEASRRATAFLRQRPGDDLISLMEGCHASLHGTRGAVLSLVSLSEGRRELTWLGVGDVSATLVRADARTPRHETLLLRPGIVGQHLPRLITETLPLAHGDALVMCTDGIRSAYIEAIDEIRSPRRAADRLLADYARGYDDALVIVACYTDGDALP